MLRLGTRSTGKALFAIGIAAFVSPLFSYDSAVADSRGRNPVLQQLTRNTVGSISDLGLRLERGESIAFTSDGDVLGPGTATGRRSVYFYHRPSATIRRIGDGTAGESYHPARETDETHSRRPRYVAFVSTENLDPRVGNADGSPELFIYLTENGETRQITDTPLGVVNAEPYSSDGGQCIVWRSNGDLQTNDGSDPQNPGAGYRNMDGSDEIFMLRFEDDMLDRWVVTQVSNGPAGTVSSGPAIGGYVFTTQCRSTVYLSDYDQLSNGSAGVHVYNYTKLSGATKQLTPAGTFGINLNLAISGSSNFARGPFAVFQSNADLLGNGSGSFEVFRHRLFGFEQMQYSYAPVGESTNPAISDGGGYIAFESTSDLLDSRGPLVGMGALPLNADGNREIYLTKGRRRIWQITRSTSCDNSQPSIQESGDMLAFVSTCDLVPGGNPNGIEQVYFYQKVRDDDPLASAAGCRVASGCCNVANGCYQPARGRQVRPPR